MQRYTIGIDFGSLSARATLVDTASGKELAGAEYAYAHGVMTEKDICSKASADTTALQHPEDYLEALGSVTRSVLSESGIEPAEVGALAIDFTAANILPILRDGTPLCTLDKFKGEPEAYVKMWKHHGASREARILTEAAKAISPELLEPYGGVISSEWCFPKIFETLRNAPEVYREADRFIEAGDWLTLMLTGSEPRSACLAGYKALWNEKLGYPEDAIFEKADKRLSGVVRDKLSGEVKPLGSIAGRMNKYGSELTGLPEGTPVATALIDAHAALPAAGAVKPGDLMIIVGTSACHILISDKDMPVRGICGKVTGGVVPDLIAYEAGQAAVGDALSWVVKNCAPAAYEQEAERRGMSLFELLTEKAERMKIGESELVALDWWNGCRSPYADYELSGLILGLTLATPPEAIFRAVAESIAFGTRRIVEEYEKGGVPVERIVIGGGISKKNAFIMQTLANVIGKDIFVSDVPQAGALGSAIYAAVAAGVYGSLPDAAEHMACREYLRYLPEDGAKEKYDAIYHAYITLSEYFHSDNNVMKVLKMQTKGGNLWHEREE